MTESVREGLIVSAVGTYIVAAEVISGFLSPM